MQRKFVKVLALLVDGSCGENDSDRQRNKFQLMASAAKNSFADKNITINLAAFFEDVISCDYVTKSMMSILFDSSFQKIIDFRLYIFYDPQNMEIVSRNDRFSFYTTL